MVEALSRSLYQVEQLANGIVAAQLSELTPLSFGVIALMGLLTSLTPCMLSMLPLTIGYIGGYESKGRLWAARQSTWFALGLATTLMILGLVAAIAGRIYGQVGLGLPIVVSVVAILMGLNLLELVPLRLPSWGGSDWISTDWPIGVRSYLLGLTFGLVASPCSTPVLATLLAWISTTQNPAIGAGLLLAYAIGYVAPLIVVGTFTASLKGLLELRRWSGWITPTSGALLLGFGVVSLLTRLLPSGV
jgi:cytochrome c-type biogenesis protein